MEYNINLSVKIISHDKQTWTFGNRDLELPFAPTIGIKLSFSDFISHPIKSINYSIIENIFYCHTIHEIQFEDESLDFWVLNYKKNGWRKIDDLYISYVEGGVEIKEGVFKNI